MSEHLEHPAERPNGLFSEKLRLIRFRMKKENLRFADEIRLVPRSMLAFVAVLFVIAQITALLLNLSGVGNDGQIWPPGYGQAEAALIMASIVTAASIPIIAILFLIGYVNRDARRRGMNSTLWTLLVIILLPAYLLTGFVIYFLVRAPLPYRCPQCGSTVSARFNYCPNCKQNLRPTCPHCSREVQASDRYCPHCGYTLTTAESHEETGTLGAFTSS